MSDPSRMSKLYLTKDCSNVQWRLKPWPDNERKLLPKPLFVKKRVKKVAISIVLTKEPKKGTKYFDLLAAQAVAVKMVSFYHGFKFYVF